MSETKCPECARLLTAAEIESGACPDCGATLYGGQTVPMAPAEDEGTPEDSTQLELPEVADQTAIEKADDSTIMDEAIRQAKSGSAEEEFDRTILDPLLQSGPPQAEESAQTFIEDPSAGQSVEEETALESAFDETGQTVASRNFELEQTLIDENFDSEPDLLERTDVEGSPEKTEPMGFRDLSDDELRNVTAMWGADDTHDDNNVEATFKVSPDQSGTGSSLVVQRRRVARVVEPGSEGADYRIQEMLGAGGIGVVYAARQSSIDRVVAMKMLKGESARNSDQRQKFVAEAVVIGELEHPNIIPIYDLAKNDADSLFYTMKRVQGTPWTDAIDQNSLEENLEILKKVTDAIGFAHSRGVIHRDLKPDNVMLGGFGEVLVMDWGIALVKEWSQISDSIDETCTLGGTPVYMAPEMTTGPVEAIMPTSDVYLLGGLLFRILTGKTPHPGKSLKECVWSAAKNVIRETDVTGELMDVALKAMATRPQDRYATASDFKEAIREYESHTESISLTHRSEDILAQVRDGGDYQQYAQAIFGFEEAISLWSHNERAQKGRINAREAYAERALINGDLDLANSLLLQDQPRFDSLRERIGLAMHERDERVRQLRRAKVIRRGLVTLIVVIVAGAYWQITESLEIAKQERDTATKAKDEANKSLIAEQEAVEQQRKATNEAKEQRKIAVEQWNAAVIAQSLEAQAKSQQEYESYLAKMSLALAKIEDNAFDEARRILDDYLHYPRRDWEWNRLKYLSSRNLGTVTALTPQNAVAISTSGHQFAVGGEDGTVALYFIEEVLKSHDEQQPEPMPVWSAKHSGGSPVHSVAFSPDDRLVISGAEDGTIEIRSVDDGPVPIWSEQAHDDAVLSVRTAQDSQHSILITASKDHSIAVWDLKTQRQLQRLLRHSWWVWDAVPAPDLSYLVSAGQDGKLICWKRNTQESETPQFKYEKNAEVAPLHGGPVYSVDISADGKLVASAGDNGDVLVWSPHDVKGIELVKLVNDETVEPPNVVTLTAHTGPARCVRFSPDPESKRLVSSGDDHTLRLWNRLRGTLETTFRGHGKPVSSCALTPSHVTQLAKDAVIVSAGRDQKTLLWDTAGYGEFRVFRAEVLSGHSGPVRYATFNGDGTLIATVSADESLRVRRIDTGDVKFHIANAQSYREGHNFLANSVALFRTGPHAQKWAVTSGLDGQAFLWDLDSKTSVFQFEGVGSNAVVVLTPDESRLLTDGRDGQALLWDLSPLPGENPPQPVVLRGHNKAVTAAAFSSDGRYCLTGDAAGHCRLHDLNHPGDEGVELLLGTLPGDPPQPLRAHSQKVTAVAFLPGTPFAVTASMDKTVLFWDWKSHETPVEIPEKRLIHPDSVRNMLLTEDPPLLVTVSVISGKTSNTSGNEEVLPLSRLRAYRPDTGKLVAETKTTDAWVTGLAQYDSKPRFLLTLTVNGPAATNRLALWSPSEPANRQLAPLTLPEQTGSIWSAEVFPDHSRLIASGGRRTRVWGIEHPQADAPALTPLGIEFGPHAAISSVAFAPQNNLIVTGDDYGDIKVWNMDTQRAEVRLLGAHAGKVVALAFDPANPKRMMSAGGQTICLWKRGDDENWTRDKTIDANTDAVTSAAFSPEGTAIVTTSRDGSVRLWDSTSGTERPPIVPPGKGRAPVLCAALSRDGALLAIGGEDPTSPAQIWKHDAILDSWYLAANIHGHPAAVTSVAFSNGRHPSRLFTSSLDGTIKVWDVTRFSQVDDARPDDDLALLLAGESVDGLIDHLPSGKLPAASGRTMKSLVAHLKTIGMELNPKYKWQPSIPDDDPAANLKSLKKLLEDLETRRLNQATSENDKKPDSDLPDAGKYLAQMEPILERCRLIVEGADDLEEILTLRGHKKGVNSVVVSPYGGNLISSSEDETAILWPIAQPPQPETGK